MPLSIRAVEILREMEPWRDGEHVFPGQRHAQPLSSMALEMLLRRMRLEGVTVYGFR